jgi:hypothetical protein
VADAERQRLLDGGGAARAEEQTEPPAVGIAIKKRARVVPVGDCNSANSAWVSGRIVDQHDDAGEYFFVRWQDGKDEVLSAAAIRKLQVTAGTGPRAGGRCSRCCVLCNVVPKQCVLRCQGTGCAGSAQRIQGEHPVLTVRGPGVDVARGCTAALAPPPPPNPSFPPCCRSK